VDKTETILFHSRRHPEYTNLLIRIKGSFVQVRLHIKYLGMVLDSKLNFRQHFQHLDNKVGRELEHWAG